MRARNIKPGFFKSDTLGGCSPLARLLYQGLWCLADHEGRMRYRPRRLKVEVLPYDSVEVSELLAELVAADMEDPLLIPYGGSAEEPQYLWLPKFKRHQNPTSKERAKPSPLPPCPAEPGFAPTSKGDAAGPGPGHNRDSSGSADILIPETGCPDVPIPDAGCPDGGESPPSGRSAAKKKSPPPAESLMKAWNTVAEARGLVPCQVMGAKRRAALHARWKEAFWREHYAEALERLRAIRWVRGENDRKWRADVEWFLRPDTVTKLLEGGYDDNVKSVGASRSGGGLPF